MTRSFVRNRSDRTDSLGSRSAPAPSAVAGASPATSADPKHPHRLVSTDADRPDAACAATTDFGVRGLVRAFQRRLVAVERKRASCFFSVLSTRS
jgi:hypothetical protein